MHVMNKLVIGFLLTLQTSADYIEVFDTVAEMSATTLSVEGVYQTRGYYDIDDGGGATYIVKTASDYGATPDEYGDHTVNVSDVAVLQSPDHLNVRQYGARGNGTWDDRDAIEAACNAAVRSNCTRKVYFPAGIYVINSNGGTILLQEGIRLEGEGGLPVRRPTVELQGTVLHIKGQVYSPFTYERGIHVSRLFIDYPDQDEDPVTPDVYPFCFDGSTTGNNGGKSCFDTVYFDRTYRGIRSTGGTVWNNVHGTFYHRMFTISSSSAINWINNCSASALWHLGSNSNTLAYQQDNLAALEINGGSDGLTIDGYAVFTAKAFVTLTGGDSLNFFRVGDSIFDGVMDPIANDGTVKILNAQFDNCIFRANNEWGSTYRASSIILDGPSYLNGLADQTLLFSNCKFRVGAGGFLQIVSGLDKISLNNCSFYDWNGREMAYTQSLSAIQIEDTNCVLVVTGGTVDNTNRYDDGNVVSRFIHVKGAKRITITGVDCNKINSLVNVSASVALPKLTITGCSGDDVDNSVSYGSGASVTSLVDANNNF